MFKRLAKKREKRERDEELGLDDEAKQMFGLQDTDSDESSSDASSDSGSDSGSNGAAEDGLDTAAADIRTEWLPGGGEDSELEDESDEDLEEGQPPISLIKAIKDPIYRISPDRDERRCIVCPKKILKTDKMVDVHCSSAAHTRRFTRFCQLSESPDNRSNDPRRIVAAISQKASTDANTEGVSNRSLKRKQKLEAIKQKREKTKRIIASKKKKREQKQEESPIADGDKRKIGNTDLTDDVGAAEFHSDKQTSGRSGKRRKVIADETSGQKDSDDRGEITNPERKPEKKTKKTKVKPPVAAESTERVDEREDVEPTQTLSGVKAAPTSDGDLTKVRISEDDGTKPPLMQKRDRKGIKRKGHMDRKGDIIFTVKEKKRGKPRTEGKNSGRKFSAATKKSARYFDGPEDRVGGNGPKQAPAKMSKTQAKKLKRAAKRDGIEHVSSNWREKAASDLVIFD